jgi:hypothetical protein
MTRLRIPAAFGAGFVLVLGFVVVVGALLPRTHTATRSAHYATPPDKAWSIISNFDTQLSWRPGLKSVRRLPDHDGHPVWNVIGSSQPGIPGEIEVFEVEIPALAVWLGAPARRSLVEAEQAMKDLDFEIEVFEPPHRMRRP